MSTQNLEIRRSSASVWGSKTGMRTVPTVSKYIDTTTCIGCKACEAACQEWNDLGTVATQQTGTYQTLPTLHAQYWNLIRFTERDFDGGIAWLMRKDQCMHCEEPGCLAACPAPGAIVQYANGIVDVNPDQCIGCGYCETGCPFDVPRFHATTGKMAKCTLCVDRTSVGLEPACIKACPTGCLQFGTKDDMVVLGNLRVEQLKANGFAQRDALRPEGRRRDERRDGARARRPPRLVQPPGGPARPDPREVLEIGPAAARGRRGLWRRPRRLRALHEVRSQGGPRSGRSELQPSGCLADRETTMSTVAPHRPIDAAIVTARDREDVVVGNEIVRHNRASRLIHWTVALTFFVCVFTGMPIWTPDLRLDGGPLRRPVGLPGHSPVGRSGVHALDGRHVLRMGFRHAPEKSERKEWISGGRAMQYMRYETDDSNVGKYNGGQKLFFFAVCSARWASSLGA